MNKETPVFMTQFTHLKWLMEFKLRKKLECSESGSEDQLCVHQPQCWSQAWL